jgi:hypothetical protein
MCLHCVCNKRKKVDSIYSLMTFALSFLAFSLSFFCVPLCCVIVFKRCTFTPLFASSISIVLISPITLSLMRTLLRAYGARMMCKCSCSACDVVCGVVRGACGAYGVLVRIVWCVWCVWVLVRACHVCLRAVCCVEYDELRVYL